MVKKRLDILVVDQQLVESRSMAQRIIMAGKIRVDGEIVLKPSTQVFENSKIEIIQNPPFVSRGGEKLQEALNAFNLSLRGLICADVGSSTGGFTDCMLQRGAQRVYAIDVGKGILDWKLRTDKRVIVMEGVNARYLEKLDEQVDFVAIDVSFISIKIILPVIQKWLRTTQDGKKLLTNHMIQAASIEHVLSSDVVALIKPQFEAGRAEVSRGAGVIRDSSIHRRVLMEILSFAHQVGFGVNGLVQSPLVGPKGNIEFLCWLKYPSMNGEKLESLIAGIDGESHAGR